ncbi:hypothetical protein ABIF66_000531 [Bradyrhizobium japonicum]
MRSSSWIGVPRKTSPGRKPSNRLPMSDHCRLRRHNRSRA